MQMRATMYEAMQLLECDLMAYTMFQYECGLIYLRTVLKGDADAIRQMEESVAYWGWWKLHWYLREREWLDVQPLNAQQVMKVCGAGRLIVQRYYASSPIAEYMRGGDFYKRVYHLKVHNTWMLANGSTMDGKKLDESWCRDLVRELR